MPFKPMPLKTFEKYIKSVDWVLAKGKIDWNIYTSEGNFVCSIIVAHGKNTEAGVTAFSVNKIKKAFEERGLKWPPNLKSKKN